MLIGERDAEHGAGKNRPDRSLDLDGFFGIHDVDLAKEPTLIRLNAGSRSLMLPAIARERTVPAVWTRPLFARARFIDVECSAVEFLAVEGGHGGACFRAVIHGDERKTARFAGHAVHHQRNFADFAMLFEKILKIVFSSLKREISYVQFHYDLMLEKLPASEPFPGIGFQITTEEFSADDLPCNE